jgi:hypothetical protein
VEETEETEETYAAISAARDGPYELIVEGPTYEEAMRNTDRVTVADWKPLGVAYDDAEVFTWDESANEWKPLDAAQTAPPPSNGGQRITVDDFQVPAPLPEGMVLASPWAQRVAREMLRLRVELWLREEREAADAPTNDTMEAALRALLDYQDEVGHWVGILEETGACIELLWNAARDEDLSRVIEDVGGRAVWRLTWEGVPALLTLTWRYLVVDGDYVSSIRPLEDLRLAVAQP